MKRWHHLTLGLVLVLAGGSALGQVESPLVSRLQLNFANPGGKSLAMGGAFVSLADDATSAFANPAGLTQIPSLDVGVSGKSFNFDVTLNSANFFMYSDKAGYQYLGLGDTYKPSDKVTDLEYISVAGPLTEKLSFALYRAVNLRYKLDAGNDSTSSAHDYRLFSINVDSSQDFAWTLDEQGAISLKNEVYGLSLAYSFGALSLGAGLTLNKLTFEMSGGQYYGAHTFIVNRGFSGRELDVDVTTDVTSGSKLGWNAGFRWQVDERLRLNVGGVYRVSPKFDVDYQMRYYTPGTKGDTFTCAGDPTQCGTFKLPDDWSLGVSIQPVKYLTLAFDVQRVMYSQLNDSFVPVFKYQGCTDSIPLNSCTSTSATNVSAYVQGTSDDATIPRVGAEFAIPVDKSTLFLRGGWYSEPSHNTRMSLAKAAGPRIPGAPVTITTPPFSAAFDYGTNVDSGAESHGTFGVGASLGRNFSLDFGADLGKTNKYYVLSAFYRFR